MVLLSSIGGADTAWGVMILPPSWHRLVVSSRLWLAAEMAPLSFRSMAVSQVGGLDGDEYYARLRTWYCVVVGVGGSHQLQEGTTTRVSRKRGMHRRLYPTPPPPQHRRYSAVEGTVVQNG